MHLNKTEIFRNLLRIPFIFLVIAPMLLFSPKSPAFADGMIMEVNQYGNEFNYYDEENQNAVISWENGMEKMVLVVGASGDVSSDLVWLFPVPAEPDRIVLDILESIPALEGSEITELAQSSLDEGWKVMEALQLYTTPFISSTSILESGRLTSEAGMTFSDDMEDDANVTIYEHIEKEGIVSELITARTGDGLENYLREKGLEVSATAIPVLNNYIGQGYSFVVSWIPQIDYGYSRRYTTMQKGVYVTFPADEIYFPLLPTSVYDSKVVPASIWVLGFVTPRLFGDLEKYVTSEYYIDGVLYTFPDLENFYSGDSRDVTFTRIDIIAQSKYLTDDLWMTRGLPPEKRFAMLVATRTAFLIIPLIILASVFAGIIAGLFAFRKQKVKFRTLVLLGLSNCLSLLGTVLSTLFIRIERIGEDGLELIDKIRAKGYVKNRTVASILFTCSIPFLIIGFIEIPFEHYRPYLQLPEVIIMYVIPIIAFMSALLLMRVDRADRGLFKELKATKISTMVFQPITLSKLAFLVMFSIFYLGISWVLIKMVRMFI